MERGDFGLDGAGLVLYATAGTGKISEKPGQGGRCEGQGGGDRDRRCAGR